MGHSNIISPIYLAEINFVRIFIDLIISLCLKASVWVLVFICEELKLTRLIVWFNLIDDNIHFIKFRLDLFHLYFAVAVFQLTPWNWHLHNWSWYRWIIRRLHVQLLTLVNFGYRTFWCFVLVLFNLLIEQLELILRTSCP